MMRSLQQPGPVHPSRIDSVRGDLTTRHYTLTAGATLNRALTEPLVEAGLQSATITLRGVLLNPFRYVLPAPADDARHVAYFSAPHAPPGTIRIEQANATFGWADGQPLVHCHAVWQEPDGRRRGGHILPHETVVAEPAEATAWGFPTIRIEAAADAETNFTLFQPAGLRAAGVSTGHGRGIVARVKPNQDIISAIETIARTHGITDAIVRGSLGSLIGTRFSNGVCVPDHATEVLVRDGYLRAGTAFLDLLVVDMAGQVHEGPILRGQNPVCITFELGLDSPGLEALA